MADYAERFSEAIGPITEEEEKWIEVSLGSSVDLGDMESAEYKGLCEELGLDEVNTWPPCAWEIQEDAERGKFLWLHDNAGNLDGDSLVGWLQAFLRKFDRGDKVVKIGIACTVSRPLLGEFGGRWILVTANDAFFGSTWDDMDTKIKELSETP